MLVVMVLILFTVTAGKKAKNEDKPEWAKKDIRDYRSVLLS